MRPAWRKALVLACALSALPAAPPGRIAGLPAGEALRLGERMYREGLAPSGEPFEAFVKGDIPVDGTMLTCVSCHLRGGLGALEGRVPTPAINGPRLYRPRSGTRPAPTSGMQEPGLAPIAPRPAYTDQALAQALRTGFDPAGRELLDVMPRYILSDPELAILIAYLKQLSSAPSPGVTATHLRFATVITEEVSREDRDALLAPLEYYVAHYVPTPGGSGGRMRLQSGEPPARPGYPRLALAHWVLRGPPETWTRQLEAYQRKEPVFALLGGITYGAWRPIHEFCETRRIPCLFPLTDLPVVSDKDWYTLYFSKGYHQEGQAAARHLAARLDPSADADVLQLARNTPAGTALAQGFRETWNELGRGPVREVTVQDPVAINLESLRTATPGRLPVAILLWAGAEAYPLLEALAQGEGAASPLYMSSSCLQQALWSLPGPARPFTWITYPYRHPSEELKETLGTGFPPKSPRDDARIRTRSITMIRVLGQALRELDRDFYRDALLDAVGMQEDLLRPDYVRLSFGPGQRYASKGCYIMQLSAEEPPELVKKSAWVIQ